MEIFFGAEKDAVTERELKAELVRLFDSFGGIEVAYLVLGHYDDNPSRDVILCLLMNDGLEDADLVNRIHEIFSRIFSSQEHLGRVFLLPA